MELLLITKLINLWDPFGVIWLGPIDEYKNECLHIIDILKEKDNEIKIKLYKYLRSFDVLNTTNDTKMNELIDLIVEIHKNFS